MPELRSYLFGDHPFFSRANIVEPDDFMADLRRSELSRSEVSKASCWCRVTWRCCLAEDPESTGHALCAISRKLLRPLRITRRQLKIGERYHDLEPAAAPLPSNENYRQCRAHHDCCWKPLHDRFSHETQRFTGRIVRLPTPRIPRIWWFSLESSTSAATGKHSCLRAGHVPVHGLRASMTGNSRIEGAFTELAVARLALARTKLPLRSKLAW